jgi:hypothetical protein
MTAQPRLAVLVGQGEIWNTSLASVQRAWYQPGLACKLRQVCHVVEFESKHIRTKKGSNNNETYATAFTLIPFGIKFWASDRVKPTIAPLVDA